MMDTPHLILLGLIFIVLALQVITMVMLQQTKSKASDADMILKTLQNDVSQGKTALLQAYHELVSSGLIPSK